MHILFKLVNTQWEANNINLKSSLAQLSGVLGVQFTGAPGFWGIQFMTSLV